jgi:hypothetical protein
MQHDPQKTLTDLRDHLARHDKPIAFLIGAGVSCAVQVAGTTPGTTKPIIPAVKGLTEICKADVLMLGGTFPAAWAGIEKHFTDLGQDPHIENILSRLRMMLRAIGADDKLCGLEKAQIVTFEETVRKTIARVVNPDCAQIPTDCPHRDFAQWLGKSGRKTPVEIFTLNYDVLLEHALEAERVPIFDGFVGSYQPFFYADSLRRAEAAPGAVWARLWKMHGSITWRRVMLDGRERVVRAAPDPTGAMIYPSFEKYDESRQQPYSAFADRLARFLEQDDALLIVSGFSFGDEHINNLIFTALENRPRTHVYALQYDELPEATELVKRGLKRPNLIIIGPENGVIGGRRAPWLASKPPSFMADAFELRTVPSAGGGDPNSVGVMKIGDFAAFANFLRAMASA